MAFAVKTITYQQNLMLNICDTDLVGRTIKKEDFSLNISKSYFADRFVEKAEAEELLKKETIDADDFVKLLGPKKILVPAKA